MIKNKTVFLIVFACLLVIFAGCSSGSSTSTEGSGDNGEQSSDSEEKVLNVAMNAAPPNLDYPTQNAVATRDTARLIFETLVTTNSDYEAVPMLAESVDVSDDNQTYTFHLRENVKFHNGKEMTSEDVVASMERWMDVSSLTGRIFDGATWDAEDDYTVVLQLDKPSVLTLDTLASAKQSPAIMPKEVVEGATAEGVEEYIGTGPFEFVEWKQDQYIHFTKYDDYQSVDEEVDGLAGKREALVDDIYFHIVTDSNTRLAGLQTGEYDIAYRVPYDDYEKVNNDPDLDVYTEAYGEIMFMYNTSEGLASDFKMREAINAAINVDDVMKASIVNEDLYWLSPGYMHKEIKAWASDAGEEYYNQNDPEKAKQILDEIGYDGEEFIILTSPDIDYQHNAVIVIQEQLNQIGMNVKLEAVDWPTFLDRMDNNLGSWDALGIASSIVSTPSQLISISPDDGGGVNNDHILDMVDEIETAADRDEAKQLWDELQLYAWEEHLPVTMLGGYNVLFGTTDEIEGFSTFSGPIFWNTSK